MSFGHDQMHHKLNDSSNYQIQEIEANFFCCPIIDARTNYQ